MVAMRLWHFYPTIILARSGRGGALLRLGLLRSWVAPHKQWLRLRPSTCVPVDGAQELRGLGRHRGGLSDAFFIITASLPLSLNLSLALSLSLSLSLFLSALLFLSLSLALARSYYGIPFTVQCNITRSGLQRPKLNASKESQSCGSGKWWEAAELSRH